MRIRLKRFGVLLVILVTYFSLWFTLEGMQSDPEEQHQQKDNGAVEREPLQRDDRRERNIREPI